MEEVLLLADRVTVLRDGRYVGDLARAEATPDKIVALMVGRELSGAYFPDKAARTAGEAVLDVKDLLVPARRRGVSFAARRGRDPGLRRPGRRGAHRADGRPSSASRRPSAAR